MNILKDLLKLENQLDKKGLTKESKMLSLLIKKFAQEQEITDDVLIQFLKDDLEVNAKDSTLSILLEEIDSKELLNVVDLKKLINIFGVRETVEEAYTQTKDVE